MLNFSGVKVLLNVLFRGSMMYFMGANSWKFWRLFIYEKQEILWIMSLFAASFPWMKRRKGTRRIGESHGRPKPQWGGCTFWHVPFLWIMPFPAFEFHSEIPIQPIWFFRIITRGPLFFPKCGQHPFEQNYLKYWSMWFVRCVSQCVFSNGLYGFVSVCLTWRACWNWENWGCMCYVNRPSVEAKAEINNENNTIESQRVMFVGGWMSSPPVGKFGDVIRPSVEAEINIIHRTVPPSLFPRKQLQKDLPESVGGWVVM